MTYNRFFTAPQLKELWSKYHRWKYNICVYNGGPGSGRKPEGKTKEQKGIDYYKNKLQGKSVLHKEVGKIDFTGKGLKETMYKGYPELLHRLDKTIKGSKHIETKPLYKVRKDDAISFSTLKNKKIEVLTRNFKDNKQFYLVRLKDIRKKKE
jgi:hypothetical protein